MSDYYVYVHLRGDDRSPFYIGKGKGRRANAMDRRSAYWRATVKAHAGRHVLFLAQGLEEEFALLLEVEAIDQYRRLGAKLVNLTSGGDGVSGLVFSAETRKKLAARVITPEWRQRMSAAAKGRKLSPEQRLAISKRVQAECAAKPRKPPSRKGKVHTQEARAKMSAAAKARVPHNKGKPATEAERARLAKISALGHAARKVRRKNG